MAAVVEEEGEIDVDVEADAQDVGLDGGAEAQGGFEVGEALDEAAAGFLGRGADLEVDEAAEHVGAGAQLDRVDGTGRHAGFGSRFGSGRRLGLHRRWRAVAGGDQGEEEEAEAEE